MATRTSAKSGNWSATDTRDGGVVPVNGDSFTIASGHTVVFDVDQSGMATGMAASTITGTLTVTTAASTTTFLKMNGNISGTGNFYAGNSASDPIPKSSTFTLEFQTLNSIFSGPKIYLFGWIPTRSHSTVAAEALAGATSITFTDNLELVPGDEIVIGSSAVSAQLQTTRSGKYTVQSYNAGTKTATLVEPLGHDRSPGDLVGTYSRPVVIKRVHQYWDCPTLSNNSQFNAQGALLLDCGAIRYATAKNEIKHCTRCSPSVEGFKYSDDLIIRDCVFYGQYYAANTYSDGEEYIPWGRIASNCDNLLVERCICIGVSVETQGGYGCQITDCACQNISWYFMYVPDSASVSGFVGIGENKTLVVRRGSTLTGIDVPDGTVACLYSTRLGDQVKCLGLSKALPHVEACISRGGCFIPSTDHERAPGATLCSKALEWGLYPRFCDTVVTFPAGVPLSFTIWVRRVGDGDHDARLQIVDPENDPWFYWDPTLWEATIMEWIDNDAVVYNDTYEMPDTYPEALAESIAAAGFDAWIPMTVTYESPTTRALIVRVFAHQRVSTAAYNWLPPYEEGSDWPVGALYFDMSELREGLTMGGVGRTTRLD